MHWSSRLFKVKSSAGGCSTSSILRYRKGHRKILIILLMSYRGNSEAMIGLRSKSRVDLCRMLTIGCKLLWMLIGQSLLQSWLLRTSSERWRENRRKHRYLLANHQLRYYLRILITQECLLQESKRPFLKEKAQGLWLRNSLQLQK